MEKDFCLFSVCIQEALLVIFVWFGVFLVLFWGFVFVWLVGWFWFGFVWLGFFVGGGFMFVSSKNILCFCLFAGLLLI